MVVDGSSQQRDALCASYTLFSVVFFGRVHFTFYINLCFLIGFWHACATHEFWFDTDEHGLILLL